MILVVPFRMFEDGNQSIKQRFYENHLPPLKPSGQPVSPRRQPTELHLKRRTSTFLPPVVRQASSNSILDNSVEKSSNSYITNQSAAREAAQRFILRNQLAKFSHDSSSYLNSTLYQRRKTLYQHIQPKINTGLPRSDTRHQLPLKGNHPKPHQPLNWFHLKKDLEQDKEILRHSKDLHFNSGENYAEQLTSLGDLVRSKVKTALASERQHYQNDQYKIVVHLTVVPRTAVGLNVASRCLWNARTDNSLTLKMSGVDCDILIIIFLCYTDGDTL